MQGRTAAIKTERTGEDRVKNRGRRLKGFQGYRELGGYGLRQGTDERGQWHDDEKLCGDQYVGCNLVKPRTRTHPAFFLRMPGYVSAYLHHFFFISFLQVLLPTLLLTKQLSHQ